MATRGRKRIKDDDAIYAIESMLKNIVDDVARNEDPTLAIPTRSMSNSNYDTKRKIIRMGDQVTTRNLCNLSTAKKFMLTTMIASTIRTHLLDTGKTTSIRDLYYMIKRTISGSKENTVDDQQDSDIIIEDLEVMLGLMRERFNLFASNRGSMIGPMKIVDGKDTINLARMGTGGWSVPSIVENNVVSFKDHAAKFVLLVEKDAVWRRLNEDRFWDKHRCMLITGQGQPSRGVRRLIYRMHHELGLPIYVLVDGDPWGLYIYSVIRTGSMALAFESERMAIPDAKFLGISAFDIKRYDIDVNCAIDLNKKDIAKAKQMLGYPWFKDKRWQREIKKMLRSGSKYEIEALSARGLEFVGDYLSTKIKKKDWLD